MLWRSTLPELPLESQAVDKYCRCSVWQFLVSYCRRPHFSVRTLVFLMTLVCAYFGAWEMTKQISLPTLRSSGQILGDDRFDMYSPLPFVVIVGVDGYVQRFDDGTVKKRNATVWDIYLCIWRLAIRINPDWTIG